MSLKYAILGLLDLEPHYGYAIKQKFEHMMGDLWPVSYGQLYPTLRKLQEDKLVTMKTVQGKKAVDKNVYSITDKGNQVFAAWLRDQKKKEQISIKDEFSLSLFFLDRLEKTETKELLYAKVRELDALHKKYTELYEQYGEKAPVYKKALTRKMILHIEAEKLWLEEVIENMNLRRLPFRSTENNRTRENENQ
jgi:PadR family transcriptional regulator AphA